MYEILFPPKTLVKYIKTQNTKGRKNTKWNKSNKTLEAGNQGNYGKGFNKPLHPTPELDCSQWLQELRTKAIYSANPPKTQNQTAHSWVKGTEDSREKCTKLDSQIPFPTPPDFGTSDLWIVLTQMTSRVVYRRWDGRREDGGTQLKSEVNIMQEEC